jgi:hypothetical protein
MPEDIETIAPASASTCSPASIWTTSIEYDGR